MVFFFIPYWETCKEELENIKTNEHLKWLSRANAHGSGMVINETTQKIENAVDADECQRRAENYENISESRIFLMTLGMWIKPILLFSTVITVGLYFITTIKVLL